MDRSDKRRRALDLLELLISNDPKKPERTTDLLLDHAQNDFSDGWVFCLPRAFRDSLDIKLTDRVIKKKSQKVWTQGSEFSFSDGEVLYDTHLAYSAWSEALKHFKVMIQIKSASPAVPGKERFPGKVKFEVWVPDKTKLGIEKLGEKEISQDEFVRLLIMGPGKSWPDLLSTNEETTHYYHNP